MNKQMRTVIHNMAEGYKKDDGCNDFQVYLRKVRLVESLKLEKLGKKPFSEVSDAEGHLIDVAASTMGIFTIEGILVDPVE